MGLLGLFFKEIDNPNPPPVVVIAATGTSGAAEILTLLS